VEQLRNVTDGEWGLVRGPPSLLPMFDESVEYALIVGGQISELGNWIDGDLRECFGSIKSVTFARQSARLDVLFRVALGVRWIPERGPLFDIQFGADFLRLRVAYG